MAVLGPHFLYIGILLGDLPVHVLFVIVVVNESRVEFRQIQMGERLVKFRDAPSIDVGIGHELAHLDPRAGDARHALGVDFNVVADGKHRGFLRADFQKPF